MNTTATHDTYEINCEIAFYHGSTQYSVIGVFKGKNSTIWPKHYDVDLNALFPVFRKAYSELETLYSTDDKVTQFIKFMELCATKLEIGDMYRATHEAIQLINKLKNK